MLLFLRTALWWTAWVVPPWAGTSCKIFTYKMGKTRGKARDLEGVEVGDHGPLLVGAEILAVEVAPPRSDAASARIGPWRVWQACSPTVEGPTSSSIGKRASGPQSWLGRCYPVATLTCQRPRWASPWANRSARVVGQVSDSAEGLAGQHGESSLVPGAEVIFCALIVVNHESGSTTQKMGRLKLPVLKLSHNGLSWSSMGTS